MNNIQTQPPPDESDCTSHLSQWYHCSNNKGLPDSTLSQAWQTSKCISFVFHHRSQGEIKNKDSAQELPKSDPSSKADNIKVKARSKNFSTDDEDTENEEYDDSKDSDFE